MKFLVDECAGRQIFNCIKDNGHDVLFVKDEYEGASDNWVLEKAFKENRILVTCDKDFGDIVFRDQKKHSGILLLRLVDESVKNKVRIIAWILENHQLRLQNNFVLVTDKNIRIVEL